MTITKRVMWGYAARSYDIYNPRSTRYVQVNIPATLPQDDKDNKISLGNNYFINENYPSVEATATSLHYYTLPLLAGTSCPVYFDKGTKFMVMCPTDKIEESYIIYA